jgi:hypothetical protein
MALAPIHRSMRDHRPGNGRRAFARAFTTNSLPVPPEPDLSERKVAAALLGYWARLGATKPPSEAVQSIQGRHQMRPDLAACYGQERLPRYTSYPTAPHFSSVIGPGTYAEWLKAIPPHAIASLYLHVPFCRSMCWYCGCHTSVARRDEPVAAYAAALRREIDLVSRQIDRPSRWTTSTLAAARRRSWRPRLSRI